MKLKYLLTAMAVPALLAACSQDEFENLSDNNQQLLGKVAGKINFDVTDPTFANTRISWGATGNATLEDQDEMSLFWVGASGDNKEGGAYKAAANALYKRNNGLFESQNIVYVGKHIIVFPVDKEHFTDQKIEVATGEEQDGGTSFGKRSIWTSDLIDIITPVDQPEKDKNYAGYGKTVNARVTPLTSQLAFNLNFNIPSTIADVTVKKVVIKSNKEVFASKGNLGEVNSHIGLVNATRCSTLTLNMPADTKVSKINNTLLAQIAVLPTDVAAGTNDDATYEIQVVTNYGTVTINKAKAVTRGSGENMKYQTADGTLKEVDESDALDFVTEFKLINKYSTTDGTEDAPNGDAQDERSWGKRIVRNVAVNMADASISNMAVANSEELIDAYNTYKILGKTGIENFVLTPGNKSFVFTPEALDAMNETKVANVTLSFDANCTGLELSGDFTDIPEFGTKITDLSGKPVILSTNANGWKIDVKNAKKANQFQEIIVSDNLTLSENATTANGEAALTKGITNKAGVVKVESNVTMPTVYTAQNVDAYTAETNITAGTFKLSQAGEIAGNVTIAQGTRIIVDAASSGVTFSGDVTLDGSLLQTDSKVLNISGNVTMGERGSLIATVNTGVIELSKRNQNVTVSTKGDIKWTYTGSETFTAEATDAFNHLVINKDIDLSSIVTATGTNGLETLEIAENVVVEVRADGSGADNKVRIGTVIVNENATMQIPAASEIIAGETKGAGNIEVFGAYTAGTTGSWTGNIFKY